jgi:hypothetical protein
VERRLVAGDGVIGSGRYARAGIADYWIVNLEERVDVAAAAPVLIAALLS